MQAHYAEKMLNLLWQKKYGGTKTGVNLFYKSSRVVLSPEPDS